MKRKKAHRTTEAHVHNWMEDYKEDDLNFIWKENILKAKIDYTELPAKQLKQKVLQRISLRKFSQMVLCLHEFPEIFPLQTTAKARSFQNAGVCFLSHG